MHRRTYCAEYAPKKAPAISWSLGLSEVTESRPSPLIIFRNIVGLLFMLPSKMQQNLRRGFSIG